MKRSTRDINFSAAASFWSSRIKRTYIHFYVFQIIPSFKKIIRRFSRPSSISRREFISQKISSLLKSRSARRKHATCEGIRTLAERIFLSYYQIWFQKWNLMDVIQIFTCILSPQNFPRKLHKNSQFNYLITKFIHTKLFWNFSK